MIEQVKTLPVDRWLEHGVLAAVSGGADSTAMLHWLARRRFGRLALGHVNHGLRGPDSDGDALFVRKLAEEYGLPYFERRIEQADWNADETGSREAAARNIRYDFLLREAHRFGFRYIAAAHTADDQIETVLHRIVRGTGLSGLAGMPRFRQLDGAVTLVRPLLDVSRTEILGYLKSLEKPYRTDATNAENDFTRNKIRNVVLPMLRNELNPNVDDALLRLARLAGENEAVLDDLVGEYLDEIIVRETPDSVTLDATALRKRRPETIREIFVRIWRRRGWPQREMGLRQWDALAGFFFHGTGRMELYGNITARHDEAFFIINLRDAADSAARS